MMHIRKIYGQDPLTDGLATVSSYQYALNDSVSNIDKNGLLPTSILCPGTSGLTVFMENAGELISYIASTASPMEKVISFSAHTQNIASTISNVIIASNEINSHYTEQGVGMLVAESETNGLKTNLEDGVHGTSGDIKGWEKLSEADLKERMLDLIAHTTSSNTDMRKVAMKIANKFFNSKHTSNSIA